MTIATWRYQIDRMRTEFARRGLRWLSPEEEAALLAYLERHAGG